MPTPWSGLNFATIREGDNGDNVQFAQIMLCNFGYNVNADAIFGANTKSKIKEFQTRCGLSSDGIVGPATWARLGPTLSSSYNYWNKTIAIKIIQREMNGLISAGLTVDGIYGTATKNAVKRYQAHWNLTQDGIWGHNCWNGYHSMRF